MKDNYEGVYRNLLQRLENIDLPGAVTHLGGSLDGERLIMPLLGGPIRISAGGMWDDRGEEPDVSTRIVICHYLLRGGQGDISGQWVSYRDFRDSGFFIANFQVNVEERIARSFEGSPERLKRAAAQLAGRPEPGRSGINFCFRLLPRIPALLLFYDRDEEFPADCKLLFDRSAPLWLDMECLAAAGWIIADRLIRAAGEHRKGY